ncbi:S8 family serine peptidase [filamentous cyanobacterium LEGE 11480]|uniref:S8 family serine peptidase n=1 Tax=Romeriopsis navalis LEGE 11480 TaxID=2777977 RepID=A0A928VUQ9_9CYAN|nr:S8 family serine peptidase [Romeriopsis navalis]MBE9032935.1 S8 family serine peptidase [Romeriopsis navalis LEGE 11480]
MPATRSLSFQKQLEERFDQTYVQTTLPIFQRQNAGKDSDEIILLHDEMILSFEPGTSERQIKTILDRYDAEVVRQLRFTKNRYLVRANTASGASLLPLVDQLGSTTGVQSASPNFTQSVEYKINGNVLAASLGKPEVSVNLPQALKKLPALPQGPYPDSLMPYQWHLNSRRRKVLGRRTDVRAPEAWKQGNRGKGAVVAVLDSTIQWDHPDLKGNLYEVPQNLPDLMPGERYGWDFSKFNGIRTCSKQKPKDCALRDPDTRLNRRELATLRPNFQRMFKSDKAVLQAYSGLAQRIKRVRPKFSPRKIADLIRRQVLGRISSEFHGTMVAGAVAAKPAAKGGIVGVAPNAKILPVRVFGLGGTISNDGLLEAIAYSAARKVDVINLSLGSLLPNQATVDTVFSVLDENPNLVIVAASGNENVDGAGYPAAIPGVLSVGATNIQGNRSPYSNYGRRIDVTAPGGDVSLGNKGGILTTGGTFLTGFWKGIQPPKYRWGSAFDPLGQYVQVQGTSFSSPMVAGVVALMKGADPERRLSRQQMMKILRQTASYQPLDITQRDQNLHRLQKGIPSTTILNFGTPVSLPGAVRLEKPLPINEYYFGTGLVNAVAAVERTKQEVTTAEKAEKAT